MSAEVLLLILVLLFTKHLIIDFPLQVPFHYLNKGIYGHCGGLSHSGLHGLGTFFVMVFFVGPQLAVNLAFLDGFIHYHIDWAKVNINNKFHLKPSNSEKFWWLLGLDQYLHSLTYLGMAAYLVTR